MNQQFKQARDAGYSDDEIINYLSKSNPEIGQKIKIAQESGYSPTEISDFISSSQFTPQEEPGRAGVRTALQGPLGLAKALPASFVPDILKAGLEGGARNTLAELQESELEQFGQQFPQEPAQQQIDESKLLKYFPTQKLAEELAEEHLGAPLRPQTELQKSLRLGGEAAGFRSGGLLQKAGAFGTSQVIRKGLVESGVPEETADALSLLISTLTPTPKGAAEGIVEKPIKQPRLEGPKPEPTIESTGRTPEPTPSGPSPFPEGIRPGEAAPAYKSPYAEQEEALRILEPGTENVPAAPERRTPSQRAFSNMTTQEARSLQGRVSPRDTDLGLRITPQRTELSINDEVGNVFSPQETFNSRTTGEATVNEIRRMDREEYADVNKLYRQSEDVNREVIDDHPELVGQINEMIANIREIPAGARSTPQKSLLTALNSLQGTLTTRKNGKFINYNPVSNQTLINTIQALRQKIDYDFAHGDANNIFKPLIRAIQESVESAAQGHPKALQASKNAREAYANWAQRFNNDYVRPLRDTSNHDYAKIYRSFLDLDEFNYLRNVLNESPRGRQLERVLAKDLTEKRLSPFLKDTKNLDQRSFDRELRELSSFATPQEIAEIRDIVEASRRRGPIKRAVHIKPAEKPKEEKRVPSYKTAEDIDKAFLSRSSIKKLKSELVAKDQEDLFNRLAEKKITEILKEGKVSNKRMTGQDLYKVLNSQKNYEILSELMGEEVVKDMLKVAETHANDELVVDMFLKILKKVTSKAMGAGILKSIFSSIPLKPL